MLTIVMPAHNEAGYLEAAAGEVVAGLRGRGEPFELVLVENGSLDQTGPAADQLARVHPEIRVVHLDVADYGLALREGFLAATGEVVVNFDVDLVDLDFLDRAVAAMADPSVSVVVGSKRMEGAVDGRSPGRKLVTGVFSSLLHHGFGLQVSDTHGLKALRREPLVPIVERCRYGKDIFDTELILRAERAGLRAMEIPVAVRELRPPRTPVVRRIPRTVLGLARLRLALWRKS